VKWQAPSLLYNLMMIIDIACRSEDDKRPKGRVIRLVDRKPRGVRDFEATIAPAWRYQTSSTQHGFVYSNGQYTSIDPPGSTSFVIV
jgi:hypothetical protein